MALLHSRNYIHHCFVIKSSKFPTKEKTLTIIDVGKVYQCHNCKEEASL